MEVEKKIDDGGLAFPIIDVSSEYNRGSHEYDRVATSIHASGMSLRDYFAAKAMQAMFNGYATQSERAPDIYRVCAREAYAVADAMIAASKK